MATFAQGLATDGERAGLLDHLEACATCRDVLTTIRDAFDGPPSVRRVGRYELLDELGRGGMGVVYEARDPVLGRRVAVKVLRVPIAPERGDEQTRLLREARAMARVVHPNVVSVHDAGVDGDQVFIAMQLVRGASLRTRLEEQPPLSLVARLALFRDAGRALAAAHAANVVHRDFKPENVLVDASGARVTDFGLAQSARADVERAPSSADAKWLADGWTRGVHGTPAYMSPEQIDGAAPLDARSDQFSFAVALYEALYGAHPFGLWGADAPKTIDALRQSMEEGPSPPLPNEASWVWPTLARALSVDPNERWPSLGALLDALDGTDATARTVARRLGRLQTVLWATFAVQVPIVLLVFLVLGLGISGLGADGTSLHPEDAPMTRTEMATALALVSALSSFPSAVLAPLCAVGLSRRAWWGFGLTALVLLPEAVSIAGLPAAIIGAYTLSRPEVRLAFRFGGDQRIGRSISTRRIRR